MARLKHFSKLSVEIGQANYLQSCLIVQRAEVSERSNLVMSREIIFEIFATKKRCPFEASFVEHWYLVSKYIGTYHVTLGFEPGITGWYAQTGPLD